MRSIRSSNSARASSSGASSSLASISDQSGSKGSIRVRHLRATLNSEGSRPSSRYFLAVFAHIPDRIAARPIRPCFLSSFCIRPTCRSVTSPKAPPFLYLNSHRKRLVPIPTGLPQPLRTSAADAQM